jgi:hypothetical protein
LHEVRNDKWRRRGRGNSIRLFVGQSDVASIEQPTHKIQSVPNRHPREERERETTSKLTRMLRNPQKSTLASVRYPDVVPIDRKLKGSLVCTWWWWASKRPHSSVILGNPDNQDGYFVAVVRRHHEEVRTAWWRE